VLTNGDGVAVELRPLGPILEETPFGPREGNRTSRVLYVVEAAYLFTLWITGPLVEVAFIESIALGVVDRLREPPTRR